MKLLILSQSEVEQLLPMPECITVMEEALSSLARGEMHQPLVEDLAAADHVFRKAQHEQVGTWVEF